MTTFKVTTFKEDLKPFRTQLLTVYPDAHKAESIDVVAAEQAEFWFQYNQRPDEIDYVIEEVKK